MALASLALAGCGGGDSSFGGGSSSGGSSGSTNVATVTVTASGASVPADGSASVTITALVRDASNVAVSNQLVTFSSSAGSLVVVQATTDGTGVATATLAAGGAAAGTAITVTASTGGVSNTTTVNVVNTQQTITLSTDLPQIPSDSSRAAAITALVRDANNQVISGVPVTFSSTSGGITVTNGTTDANGHATATLNAATDPTNRTITVTATAGAANATINVDVIGTKLTVTGPANLVQNTQGTYTVSLTDSGGKGISGRTVTLTSSAGNTLSAASVVTDATGQKTFQLTGVNGGNDTLTAAALGLQATQAIAVSTQSFTITAPAANTKVNLGVSQTITVNWTSNGTPQSGQTVTFTSTRGTLSASTATTDGSGNASVTISSTQSGPAVITASGTGVTAQVTIDFVATNPATVVLQASPSTVAIQGQSTLTAIVRDASNNLVEGVVVDFTLADITGGALSVASATTDSQGRATTVYTASSTTSSKDGVVVTASTGAATPGTARITVAGQTLFLSLGTGNSINIENAAQYSIDYAVQAIDTAGNAVANANITMTVVSMNYIKGFREWSGTVWAVTVNAACPSEDTNFNGIVDPGEDTSGTGNNNGKLDPGLVASVSPGSVTTDAAGNALVKVLYPKDHADYVQVKLTASTTVQGTEASTSATFWLPAAAPDVNKQNVAPPGVTSPYGVATSCTNPL
ncbi:MAG: Ig-like domain-containing protein [Steroidobacteraceae bacterium]